jgi:chemotaxis protein MotD
VSITVASDPIIQPPRAEPARQAAQGASEPFEQLLDAAAPPADPKPEPRQSNNRRRDDPSHGEEVRAARSNRPTDADDVTRTNGRDKAPPPKPEPRADQADQANAPSTDDEPATTEEAATETTVIEIADGEVTVTTGEDAAAVLESLDGTETTEATETTDTSIDPTVPVVDAPPAPPLPEPAIAAAVIAPAVASEAAPDATAEAAPETIIAAAAATAGVNVAATAGNAAGTTEAAPPEADAASVAADDFAAAVTGEAESEGEMTGKPATLAAATERPARPTVEAAPAVPTDETPAPAAKEAAPQSPTQANAPAHERPAHQARGAAEDKPADLAANTTKPNDAPLAQNTATPAPTVPVPTMWAADVRLRAGQDMPVPVASLAVEIVTRAQEGLKSFEIRLDPPELGRVDVRLDVDRSGNVTTRLTVDRVETLDILRRDSASLERALQQAGLKTDGGLEFSLRDQSLAHRDQSQPEQQNGTQSRLVVTEDEAVATEAARRGYGRLLGLGSGVDIRV